MKNLILTLSLFSVLGASAQTKTEKTTAPVATQTTDPRAAFETAAQKDLNNLMAFTPVSPQTQTALKDLFRTKHSVLKDIAGLPAERKNAVTESMEYRLSLLLD